MSDTAQGVGIQSLLVPASTIENIPTNNVDNSLKSDAAASGGEFSDILDQQKSSNYVQSSADVTEPEVASESAQTFQSTQVQQDILLDVGKVLHSGGELLPGLMPGSSAGWAVTPEGESSLEGGQELLLALSSLDGSVDTVELQETTLTATAAQNMPPGLAQQTSWQTPAALAARSALSVQTATASPLSSMSNTQDGAVLSTLTTNLSVVEGTSALSSELVQSYQGQKTDGSLQAAGQVLSQQFSSKGLAASVSSESALAAGSSSTSTESGLAVTMLGVLDKQLGGGMIKGAASDIKPVLNTEALMATASLPRLEGGGNYQQAAVSSEFSTAIATQVNSPGWGDTVMQRVMWMSSQQIRSAEIQLDPPELGSLQVKISTVNDQTSVTFTSAQGSVREALDQSLPRLKDMMSEQGLDLVNVDVSEHSRQGNTDDNLDGEHQDHARASEGEDPDESMEQLNSNQQQAAGRPLSLVDDYV